MPNGYTGKVLRVDLSSGKTSIDEHDDVFYRTYGGGAGMIAYYLLKEVPPSVDALGPDNHLIVANGPLTGIPVGGTGRNCIGGKSPLTGGFGQADVGGYFGSELKRAGWDGIVVTGVSDKPVYLSIVDDEIEIRDAAHLWGKTSGPTEDTIREELGDKGMRFALIGPPGEKLSNIAGIIVDKSRAAGRTGMAAVMGSKMLKAIAVRGHSNVQVADPEPFKGMAKWVNKAQHERIPTFQPHGTNGGLKSFHDFGGLPTRHFELGHFEDGWENISGERMTEDILLKNETCFACTIRCKRVVEVKDGNYDVSPEYGGPEYETVGAVGSNCEVDDLEAIAYASQLCNEYGLDTIGAGMAISTAMSWWEAGIIDASDTGGIELKFGNAEAMVAMVLQIANREGFGDILANGSAKAAEIVGKGAADHVVAIKGGDFPMHEPRLKNAIGVGFSVSPTGADHNHSIHDTMFTGPGWNMDRANAWGIYEPMEATDLSADKMRLFAAQSNWCWAKNTIGMCIFLPWDLEHITAMMAAATGWNYSSYELMQLGERVVTMARIYNTRAGFTAADDSMPERIFKPFKSGPLAGFQYPRDEWEEGKRVYYGLMGWDDQGIPTRDAVIAQGLGEFADAIESVVA
jgi:aldehyde:ferredoxin oxidoreductase